MLKAVVDVGSNSVLLLVAEQTVNGWITRFESSVVTGIGKGTKLSGRLDPEGILNTLTALRDAKHKALELGAESFVAAGTMALRIAQDADEFLMHAKAQGTPVCVISGEREADLGFRSVANDQEFCASDPLAIIDPGGHSTELVVAGRAIQFKHSFPVGALGLREKSLKGESPSSSDRFRASMEIDQLLSEINVPAVTGVGPSPRVVVLGATGTNLISIRERLESWKPDVVHGQTLDFEEVSRSVGWMFGLSDASRAGLVGIEKGREKTLHIGCLILERFLFALKAERCSVSVRGWRHALLEEEVPCPG